MPSPIGLDSMHDPKVVAFDIRRPWPQRKRDWRGRLFWPSMFTVWHVEPDGHDALTICKYTGRWQWHFWHWHIQWHFEQKLRRFLFERCEKCGHRYPWGYAPVSHQWDAPRSRWWRVEPRAFHHECSVVMNYRKQVELDAEIIRDLISEIGKGTGESVSTVVDRLTDPRARKWEFPVSYRLQKIMKDDE